MIKLVLVMAVCLIALLVSVPGSIVFALSRAAYTMVCFILIVRLLGKTLDLLSGGRV